MSELDEMIKRFDAISASFNTGFMEPQLQINARHGFTEKESRFFALFHDVWISNGDGTATGSYGNGSTPEEAMKDYLRVITGKTLIYHINTKNEIRVAVV